MSEKQKQEVEDLEAVEEKYEAYFNSLQNELISALIHLKFYDQLQELRKEYLAEFNEASTFFGATTDAHRDAVILSISKMLEERNRDDDLITIWKFLRFVESNLALFSTQAFVDRCRSRYGFNDVIDDIRGNKYKELSVQDINADREKLEEYRKVIENVIAWRDKKVAHNDKRFSPRKKKVSEEYPISSKQLNDILDQLKKLLNKYSLAYDSAGHEFNIPGDYGVQLVFEAIRVRREKLKKELL